MTTKVKKENLIPLKGVMKHRYRSIKATVGQLTIVEEVDHECPVHTNVDVAFLNWESEDHISVLSLYQLAEESQTQEILNKLSAKDPSKGIFVFDPNQPYAVEAAQLAMHFLGTSEKIDPSRFFRWGSNILREHIEPTPSGIAEEFTCLRSVDSMTLAEQLRPIEKIHNLKYFNDGEVRGICLKIEAPGNLRAAINTMPAIANITILLKNYDETYLLFMEPNNYLHNSIKRNFFFLDISPAQMTVSSISDAS